MKLKYLSYILLAATSVFCACGEDDEIKPVTLDMPHSVIGVRDAMPYAGRKEIPAIKDPNMFIVHYTDMNGVTYAIEWDKDQKTQRWAAYTMNNRNNTKGWARNNWAGAEWKGRMWYSDPFQEDSIIPSQYRTTLDNYKGSGYDRGHIVNSNDRLISQNANGQTYYLSNIQPQMNKFNAQIWLNFENVVHNWGTSLRSDETLYIVKGGTTQKTAKVPQPFLVDTKVNLKVPKYFFMAILKYNSTQQTYQAIALWVEHKASNDTNVRSYAISVDELEEKTGINFFINLSDDVEDKVEAVCNVNNWNWGKYTN